MNKIVQENGARLDSPRLGDLRKGQLFYFKAAPSEGVYMAMGELYSPRTSRAVRLSDGETCDTSASMQVIVVPEGTRFTLIAG